MTLFLILLMCRICMLYLDFQHSFLTTRQLVYSIELNMQVVRILWSAFQCNSSALVTVRIVSYYKDLKRF
jgi:hypothetical protein